MKYSDFILIGFASIWFAVSITFVWFLEIKSCVWYLPTLCFDCNANSIKLTHFPHDEIMTTFDFPKISLTFLYTQSKFYDDSNVSRKGCKGCKSLYATMPLSTNYKSVGYVGSNNFI